MAIDTAEKRRSVAGINRNWGPGVTPNASKDAEWRQQSGYGYSGIATGSTPILTPGRCICLNAAYREYTLTAQYREYTLTARVPGCEC